MEELQIEVVNLIKANAADDVIDLEKAAAIVMMFVKREVLRASNQVKGNLILGVAVQLMARNDASVASSVALAQEIIEEVKSVCQ